MSQSAAERILRPWDQTDQTRIAKSAYFPQLWEKMSLDFGLFLEGGWLISLRILGNTR